MNEIQLPKELKGRWENALIFTYGMDLPFFENALWGQFAASCRNKIILADGNRYLQASENYSRGRIVRRLNHHYIADGIFSRFSAHAKIILLTNREQGRLLVGSGNLGWQGYASGGELFTRYEFHPDKPEHLNAFLSVRELLDALREANSIPNRITWQRIDRLIQDTPWLSYQASDDWWPVHHNLQRSILEQLRDEIDNAPVEELWIASPFYDREAAALREYLTTLGDIERIYLLVQSGNTSIDPEALSGIIDEFDHPIGRFQIRLIGDSADTPYFHSKLYLFKMAEHSICVHGSANLSRAAMLLTYPYGNLEVVNVMQGKRHQFDYVLDKLAVSPIPVTELQEIDLVFEQRDDDDDEQDADGWQLTGGEWYRNELRLNFVGEPPDWKNARLRIGLSDFPLKFIRQLRHQIVVQISAEAQEQLRYPNPIVIRWSEKEAEWFSNPVFVCNRAALESVLETEGDPETLRSIDSLTLEDEEFEKLLGELEAALVLDRRSIWQVAGKETQVKGADDDDEGLRIKYIDVDYEALRHHPKLRRYATAFEFGNTEARSRLQIILSAITDHFKGMTSSGVDDLLVAIRPSYLPIQLEPEAETEEEAEEQEQELETRRQRSSQRVKRILKNFVNRYLQGISQTDFQELAGFEIMAHNYAIFSYLLWRFLSKEDWLDPEFVLESMLRTWHFYWGTVSESGYFSALDSEQRDIISSWNDTYHSYAILLASLYYGAYYARVNQALQLRADLRDFLRHLIKAQPFEFTSHVIQDTWQIVGNLIPGESPSPPTIISELSNLVCYETDSEFLHRFEAQFELPSNSCVFEHNQKVVRPSSDQEELSRVTTLVIHASNILNTKKEAVEMLQYWMASGDQDYYRINGERVHRLAFYDLDSQSGTYWDPNINHEEPIGQISSGKLFWEPVLQEWLTIAKEIEEMLNMTT